MKIVWRISVSSLMPTYKEQQVLEKVCKVTRQKQIKYYDFIPFFDFQYEKIIFNCQPSHFSPCSAVPAQGWKTTAFSQSGPRKSPSVGIHAWSWSVRGDSKTISPSVKLRRQLSVFLRKKTSSGTQGIVCTDAWKMSLEHAPGANLSCVSVL